MTEHPNINQLLLFLLEQPNMNTTVSNEMLLLDGHGIYTRLEFLPGALNVCQINIGSTKNNHHKSTFFESLENLEPFFNKFHASYQQRLFCQEINPDIRSLGPLLKAKFMADIQHIRQDFEQHLDANGKFLGKNVEGKEYRVEFAGIASNTPWGYLKMLYMENGTEGVFIFTHEQVQQYPLLKHMGLADFKSSNKNNLEPLDNPLLNYFLLQETMPSNNAAESGKKPKI